MGTLGSYRTIWRTSPARIAEEHRLHVAQLEADATRDALAAIARKIAERRGIAKPQHHG